MVKSLAIFWVAALIVLGIDQGIKQVILSGFRWEGECISIVLAYNKGVAFSMLAFLDESLKYLQVAILLGITLFLHYSRERLRQFVIPGGILIGAGLGNVIDRFIHEGVVDYVYWHCGFDFAIFNFADVMIDVAIAMVLFSIYIRPWWRKKRAI